MGLTSQTAALSLSVLAVVDLPYTYDLARATTKNWQGLDEWLVRLRLVLQHGGVNRKLFASIICGTCATTVVPEPASLLLFGTGVIGLGTIVKRKFLC